VVGGAREGSGELMVGEDGRDSTNSGQLSLLPSAGREMSTSQSAVMLCGW